MSRSFSALWMVFLIGIVIFSLTKGSIAQSVDLTNQGAVSSADFLSHGIMHGLSRDSSKYSFPTGPISNSKAASERQNPLVSASYLPPASNSALTQPDTTASAEYQVPTYPSKTTIGTGVETIPQSIEPRPGLLPNPQVDEMSTRTNQPPPKINVPWRLKDWLDLDPVLPNVLVGYEVIRFHRGNDSGGDVSNGGDFERFQPDTSARYTVSRLSGTMEQVEFVFTGPFHWGRTMTIPGPVDTSLADGSGGPSALGAIHGADEHRQSHFVSLSSYEWNRRSTGDGSSSYFYGLRMFDHQERYHLEATKGLSTGDFQLSTNNFLAGGQLGMSIVRPLSQRLSVGASAGLGAYMDFSRGSLRLVNNSITLADQNDNDFRLTWMAQPRGFVNYQVTQNSAIYGGYEAWYFRRLATVADQRFANVLSTDPIELRTRDDQLFYGWSVGLSAKF